MHRNRTEGRGSDAVMRSLRLPPSLAEADAGADSSVPVFAFLAGGVVLNVLKEELPAERDSNFAAFAVGATVFAGLLLGA